MIARGVMGRGERVVKPSWTEVASLALLFVFVAVLVKGWPSGDWSLGWGAVGAIATIVLGAIAAHISNTQKTWLAEKRIADKSRITDDIWSAIADLFMTFWFLRSALNELQADDMSDLKHWASQLEKSTSGIDSTLRSDSAYLLDKELHKRASAISQKLNSFCFLLTNAMKSDSVNARRDKLGGLTKHSDSIYKEIDQAMGDRGSAIRDMFRKLNSHQD